MLRVVTFHIKTKRKRQIERFVVDGSERIHDFFLVFYILIQKLIQYKPTKKEECKCKVIWRWSRSCATNFTVVWRNLQTISCGSQPQHIFGFPKVFGKKQQRFWSQGGLQIQNKTTSKGLFTRVLYFLLALQLSRHVLVIIISSF